MTDVLGIPNFVKVTTANITDNDAIIEILKQNIEYFRSKKVSLPKIILLLDNGYSENKIFESLQEIYPRIRVKLKIQITQKPKKSGKFKPTHKRWVIERSNSWMEKL